MASDLRDRLIAEFRWTDPGPASDVLVSDRSGWWLDPGILQDYDTPAMLAQRQGPRT